MSRTSRDYKNAGRGRGAPRTPGGVWFLAGLALGLAVALLVYLGGYSVSELRGATPAPSEIHPAQTDPRDAAQPAEAQPQPEAPPKPRFDFYTILPEMEVAVPEQETAAKPTPDTNAGRQQQPDAGGGYILQAGSFRSLDEADKLKASLVLLGVDASIQTVTVNNKDTWHRVQIGPYNDLVEVNQVRARLKQNNIEVVLLKVKG